MGTTSDEVNCPLVAVTTGTGVGVTKGTPTINYQAGKGVMVKKDGLMLPTGDANAKLKLTLSWYMNSKKDANDRYLEVTIGSDGTTVRTPTPDTNSGGGKMEDYAVEIPAGKDVYIGASNDLYIMGYTLEVIE